MASLTSNLGDINPQSRVIDPGPRSGGFLGGLSQLATTLIGAEGQRSESQYKLNNRAAVNDAAKMVTEVERGVEMSNTTPLPEPVGFQVKAADVPMDVKDSVTQLDKTKTAVSQGRSSADMLQLGLEKTLAELQAKYPDQQKEIYDYMKTRGYDHFLFREAKNAAAMAEGEDAANVAGRSSVIKSAHEAGLVLPGMSDDQIYNRGSQYLATKTQAEIAKANAEAASAAAKEGRDNYGFQRDRANESLYSATQAHIGVQAGVVTDWLSNKITEANNDPARLEQLAQLQPDIDNYVTTAKLHARGQLAAQGADKSVIDASDATYEGYRKSIQDIYFGPSSRAGMTHRAYTQMSEQLGLDTQKAMPAWSMMNRMLGAATVADMFSGENNRGLSPELIGKLKQEMLHFDPTKPNEAITTVFKIGELVKGNASLANMPESAITPDYIRGLNSAAAGNAKAILDPEPDNPTEFSDFLNSYGQVALAAASIQPGFKDLKALDYAVGSIAAPNNIAVLEKLAKDPVNSGKAREIIQVSRASASQLLEVARGIKPNGYGQIVFENGRYVAKMPKADNSFKNPGRLGPDEAISQGLGMQRQISPEINQQVQVLNSALNHLVRTSQFDDSTKNFSAMELRRHYGEGAPLGEPQKDGKGKPQKTFEQTVSEFKTALDSGITDIQTAQPFKDRVSFKSPVDAATRTVLGEASNQGEVGQAAVAAVIANRARQSGKSIEDVVLAQNQFEPWNHGGNQLTNMAESDPRYQKARAIVEAVLSGQIDDPTGGATHFYNPVANAALAAKDGRKAKPDWDNGTGKRIGDHVFFNIGYKG